MEQYRRHQLAETHRRYTVYTKQFSKWLWTTAEKRGLEMASAARTKKQTKYKIPLNRIIPLAEGIVEAGVPLEDTSGLNDLSDAIRMRKEVNLFYQMNKQADRGHWYFNEILSRARNVLRAFHQFNAEEHDIYDETRSVPIPIMVSFTSNEGSTNLSKDEAAEDESISSADEEIHDKSDEYGRECQKSKRLDAPKTQICVPTKEETLLEHDYLVLRFLFEYSELRQFVSEAWVPYGKLGIDLVTASLLTDLAFGLVRQNVSALLEELEGTDERSIEDIVTGLYSSVRSAKGSQLEGQSPKHPDLEHSPTELEDRFCIKAFEAMEQYRLWKTEGLMESQEETDKSHSSPLLLYLHWFDQYKGKKARLPVMDHFAANMVSSTTYAEPWLPFGLQMMYDVHCNVSFDDCDLFGLVGDMTEGYIKLSAWMRAHCEYEDDMWALGDKPDYMSMGETKFTTMFLKPSEEILSWLTHVHEGEKPDFIPADFWLKHPVWGGLGLYHFGRLYQTTGIGMTQWIVIVLCHLYNACRQVGGLQHAWPDLEFIIETHGEQRIFVGDRPKRPEQFYNLMCMAMQASSRALAKDARSQNGQKKRAAKEAKEKRGLMMYGPLENKIKDYYYNCTSKNRWIRLHNLFAHVYNEEDPNDGSIEADEKTAIEEGRQRLRTEFQRYATQIRPKKSQRNRRRRLAKVETPNFSKLECIHADLLSTVKQRLGDRECHLRFDYLSFYRRAFAFMQHIRSEVLFDASQELARIDAKEEEQTNYALLNQLFEALQISPKPNNAKFREEDARRQAEALEKIRKISKIMQTLIEEEGSEEQDKMLQIIPRWWLDPALYGRESGMFHRFYSPRWPKIEDKKFIAKLSVPTFTAVGVCKAKPHKSPGGRRAKQFKREVIFPCYGTCILGKCAGILRMGPCNQKESAKISEWESDTDSTNNDVEEVDG